jgi:hypothetical protein
MRLCKYDPLYVDHLVYSVAVDLTVKPQACLKVVMSTCMAHGIEVLCDSGTATKNYVKFVQEHYMTFCEDAIRCMFMCGFVPWRTRVLPNGAVIPETIPLGTFVWTAERNDNVGYRSRVAADTSLIDNPPHKRRNIPCTEALSYKIRFVHSLGIRENDVSIYQYIKPVANPRTNSLQSPLSGIVGQYRHLYRAMARSEYADEWNTQGKLVCSYTSAVSMYNMNEGNPITNDWSVPQNRGGVVSDSNLPTELEQNVYMRDAIMEQVVQSKTESTHKPVTYSLPKNSKLESVPHLQSNVDLSVLTQNTARNIASVMGVPFEIIGGGYSDKQGGKKSLENSRVFITNMTALCSHLERLLHEVYMTCFPAAKLDVTFKLRASPRLEITTIDELILLINAGLLSTENAFLMTNMILGLDLEQARTQKGPQGTQFVPLGMEPKGAPTK